MPYFRADSGRQGRRVAGERLRIRDTAACRRSSRSAGAYQMTVGFVHNTSMRRLAACYSRRGDDDVAAVAHEAADGLIGWLGGELTRFMDMLCQQRD